jgi:hypothetical protein
VLEICFRTVTLPEAESIQLVLNYSLGRHAVFRVMDHLSNATFICLLLPMRGKPMVAQVNADDAIDMIA